MYTKDKEYYDLVDYIRKKAIENPCFMERYLNAGLSPKNNLFNKLTPKLFKEFFYVEKPEEEEKEITRKIRDLFHDKERNVFGIRAHGGSGKTVFIQMLQTRIDEANKTNEYEYIPIDFEAQTSSENRYEIVIENIIKRARKWIKNMYDANGTAAYQMQFEHYAKMAESVIIRNLDNSSFGYLWSEVCKSIFDQENKDLALEINRVIRSLVFQDITEMSVKGGLMGIQVACLLLSLLIMTRPKDNKKYIVAFDNIEAITSHDMSNLPTVIIKTWDLINSIMELCGLNFCEKITFLIVVRTTTNLNLGTPQYDTFWGVCDKYIYDFNYDDFCAEALLKKLKFLHDDVVLRGTELYRNTYLLCSLLCTKSVIEKYLANLQVAEIEYKVFTRERLAPFFGNNFRQVIVHLCDLFTSSDKAEQKSRIIALMQHTEPDSIYNITINGARAILFNSIYKNFVGENIFSNFGIEPISGNPTHSITRILLSYLYWDKVRYCFQNEGNVKNYHGVGLKTLINTFKYFYPEDKMEEFANQIYKLSPFHKGDDDKIIHLSKWSYLLIINGISSDISNEEFFEGIKQCLEGRPTQIDKAQVYLSEAGLCYVTSTSIQFEFFNSRNLVLSMPLFMVDNEFNNILETYRFESIIEQNYEAVKNFVYGMFGNGRNACVLFGHEKDFCSFKAANKNQALAKFNLFACSMFIRYLEVTSTIIEAINYIDRYRQYLFYSFGDERANSVLLKQLKSYCEMLTCVRDTSHLLDGKNGCGDFDEKKYSSLFLSVDSGPNGKVLKNAGLNRNPYKAFYFERDHEECVFKALQYELEKNTGMSLFEICKNELYNHNE